MIFFMKKTKQYDDQIVEEMISETQRGWNMITTLRDISRIDSNTNIQEFSLQALIENILKMFLQDMEAKNIKFHLEVIEDFYINVDENHFFICISNILKNAIKYNLVWWEINIVIKKWKLEISDTWIWMTKQEQKRIFDRFYRAKDHRDGSGLGIWLFLVRKIAKIYKWKIEIKSEKSKGTMFLIKFF